MLLEGIETLLVLSKAKTMSRTGSLLYISQSAVSKRIARLEKQLGKKLIEPDGRQVRLTAEGRALTESLAPEFNELLGKIYEQQPLPESSVLELACSETLVSGYISPVISRLFKADPNLRLTTRHTPRIIEQVQSGKAAVGFCAGHLPPHHGLVARHLADEPFYLVCRDLPPPKLTRVITNDLSNPANTYQLHALREYDIEPLMEMDSYTASANLALAGVAPAIVPLSVVRTLGINPDQCHAHYPVLGRLKRPVYLCYRQNIGRNQRVKTVLAAIADAVATAVSAPSTST